jgi:hypothetical protein
MYAAVWTPLVYAFTTAAAGMRVFFWFFHCGTDVLTLSYGLEA